jgi:hypothetical protein
MVVKMNNLERFKAVVHFEKPDYTPVFAFSWAPGVSWAVSEPDRLRLVEEGMPACECRWNMGWISQEFDGT